MARGVEHDDAVQAAVIAALLIGQGVNQVAKDNGLDKSVVSRWKKKIPKGMLQQIATQKEADRGAHFDTLLFEALSATLKALKAQANVASDEAYLKKFPPQQLGVLFGIMADKGVRFFQALAGEDEASDGVEAE